MIPALLLAAAYLAVGAFFAGMSYGSMTVDEQIRDRYPYGPAGAVAVSLIAWPVLAVLLVRCIQASVKASRSTPEPNLIVLRHQTEGATFRTNLPHVADQARRQGYTDVEPEPKEER